MHKPLTILKIEMQKILKDFEIQTNRLIQAKRPNQVIINKKKENLRYSWFRRPGGPQNESKKKKNRQLQDLTK